MDEPRLKHFEGFVHEARGRSNPGQDERRLDLQEPVIDGHADRQRLLGLLPGLSQLIMFISKLSYSG